MGSAQSTRKLTIPNEEIGVITISNAIAQRLAQAANEVANDATQDVNSFVPPQPVNSPTALPPVHNKQVSSGQPTPYHSELTISALQIQQQKEQELQAQNQYWQRRLQNLEKKHSMIDHILEEEYKKAMNEFSTIKKGSESGNNLGSDQPCIIRKEKVLKCYQDHPKEILKCSNLVEEFTNCVDQRRVNFITTRC